MGVMERVVEGGSNLLPALSLLVLVEARVAGSPSFPCSPSESDIVARRAGSETKGRGSCEGVVNLEPKFNPAEELPCLLMSYISNQSTSL